MENFFFKRNFKLMRLIRGNADREMEKLFRSSETQAYLAFLGASCLGLLLSDLHHRSSLSGFCRTN